MILAPGRSVISESSSPPAAVGRDFGAQACAASFSERLLSAEDSGPAPSRSSPARAPPSLRFPALQGAHPLRTCGSSRRLQLHLTSEMPGVRFPRHRRSRGSRAPCHLLIRGRHTAVLPACSLPLNPECSPRWTPRPGPGLTGPGAASLPSLLVPSPSPFWTCAQSAVHLQ